MKTIKLLTINVLLASVAYLTSCGGDKAEEAAADSTANKRPVEINEVMGIAEIEPAERITELASESNGLVKTVVVKVGQELKAGQLILTLDNAVENAQLRQSNSKIATQNQAVASAQANIEVLKTQLQKAKDDLIRDQALFEGKAITQQQLDNSRYNVTNLQSQVQAQEAGVKQQRTRIGELRADIGLYQTNLTTKVVKAPGDGTLLSFNINAGEYLTSNQIIGEFAPAGPIIALTEIDELFAQKVKLGQKATIRVQGSDEVLTTGTVILTSPYLRKKSLFSDNSNNLEDRRVREVRVQLDDASKVLIGSRVECWINVK